MKLQQLCRLFWVHRLVHVQRQSRDIWRETSTPTTLKICGKQVCNIQSKQLLSCGTHLHSDEVLWENGSPEHERQHPSQFQPSAIYFQNRQINRGCHLYCPPFILYTFWKQHHLHQNTVCRFQFSIQHYLPYENSYQEEINNLSEWCTENNLLHDISKTKKMIVDVQKRRQKRITLPSSVVSSFRFLGIRITENQSWTSHISTLIKKAQWKE